jgi:hypothetical protein
MECTHEHLTDRCSLGSTRYSTSHVSRWFMGVCPHEHLTHRCSLDSALATALVMSADGSWSVCTHELFDHDLFAMRLPQCDHVSRWFMECLHS